MTEQEKAPETEAPRPQLSAKHMLAITGAVAASVGGVVLLAAGGWIAVAGAGAVTAVSAYGVHKVRHPNGRQSTIGQLLTRPRRTGGKTGWRTTASRVVQRRSTGSAGRGAMTGRSTFPKLSGPSRPTGRRTPGSSGRGASGRSKGLTTGTRARHAASLTGTRSKTGRPQLGTGTRPVARNVTGTKRSSAASKPAGLRTPRTPSRTPSRPSAARPLTPRRTGGSGAGTISSSRRPGANRRGSTSSAVRTRRSAGKISSTGRSGIPRSGTPSTRSSRGSSPRSPLAPKSRSGSPKIRTGNGTRRSSTPTPLRTTRKSTKLGTKRSTKLKRARKLGTPKGEVTSNKSPNRASKRATARRKSVKPNRTLIREALRVPTVNQRRTGLTRPTKIKARKARRALQLRGASATWRATKATAKAPHKLTTAAARNWWDGVQRRTPRLTPELLDLIAIPTVPDPAMKANPGKKATAPKTTPPTEPVVIPFPLHRTNGPLNKTLIPVTQPNGDTIYMSSRDAITDAMAQLESFEPQSGTEIAEFMAEQEEIARAIEQAYGNLAQRMRDSMPLAAPVVDKVEDLAAGYGAMANVASDAHNVMLQEHEADFDRINNPRPGEELWNPDNNR